MPSSGSAAPTTHLSKKHTSMFHTYKTQFSVTRMFVGPTRMDELYTTVSYVCVWNAFILWRRHAIPGTSNQSSLGEPVRPITLRSSYLLFCFSARIHDQKHHALDCVAVKTNKPGATNSEIGQGRRAVATTKIICLITL